MPTSILSVRRLSLILWVGLVTLLIAPAALAGRGGSQPEFIDTVTVQFSVAEGGPNGNGPDGSGPPGWNTNNTAGSFGRDNAAQQHYENAIRQAQHDILNALPNNTYEVVVQPEDEPLLVLNVTEAALTTLQAMPDIVLEIDPGGNYYFVNDNSPCVGAGCTGVSWSTAYKTLNEALTAATGGDDEIWVAAGVYYPDGLAGAGSNLRTATFQMESGLEIFGGFAGTEIRRSNRNPDVNLSILSGDVTQNDTDPDGDFIIEDPAHIPTNSNSFHVVTGSGATGGWLDGFVITGGQSNSTSPNDRGAALFNETTTSPVYGNLMIIGNTGVRGTVISQTPDFRVFYNIQMIHNRITSTSSSMFSATDSGAGNVTLTNMEFYGNSSAGGPLLHVLTGTVTNAVIVGNHVDPAGIGVTCGQIEGNTTIRNMTCAHNNGDRAFTTVVSGVLNAQNVIVFGNTLVTGVSTGSVSFTFSDVQGGAAGMGNINANPLFVTAPTNGDGNWTTLSDNNYGDVRLQAGSPAIDTADTTVVTLPYDVLNQARIVDGGGAPGAQVDMGANEYQLALPHTLTYNQSLKQSFACDAGGTNYLCYFGINITGMEQNRLYTLTQIILPATGLTDDWQATTGGSVISAVQFDTTYTGPTNATIPFYILLYTKSDMGISTTFDLTNPVYVELTFADTVTNECTRSYYIYDKANQRVEVAGNMNQLDFNNQNRAACTVGFGPTLGETYLP